MDFFFLPKNAKEKGLVVVTTLLITGLFQPHFLGKRTLAEVLLATNSCPNGSVDHGIRLEHVVVQIFERRIHPVDPPSSLLIQPVRVVQRVERNRVSRRTLPRLSACHVLDKV